MITKAFSIYDSKTKAFNAPFFQASTGGAVRMFDRLINDRKTESMLAKYPADFSLFEVGKFDDSTGRLETLKAPELQATGKDFVNPKQSTQTDITDHIKTQ